MRAEIRDMAELLAFRRDVRRFLADLDCPVEKSEAALLVLTELGTNLIRHAGGGSIDVRIREDDRRRLIVRSENSRPGVDPERRGATTPSLGIGLESLDRLMDAVRIEDDDSRFRVATVINLES